MAGKFGLICWIAMLLVGGLLPLPAVAQPVSPATTFPELPRVRASDPRLASLISEARKRSRTFSGLLTSIAATDGIVFVEEGRCRRSAPACLTWHVTLAGAYRMLFVRLDLRKSDVDLMASVGHELQHALEVLADTSLRSTTAIQLFYMRGLSPESFRTPETAAAEATGNAVFLEVQRSGYDGMKK